MRIRTHTNPFACTHHFEKMDPIKVFSEFNGKIDFEIGFGQCAFIRNHAKTYPDRLVFGIDVRKKTVDLMQEKVVQDSLKNIYLVHGNGGVCLEEMFADHSIDNIFIFHPDPWKKHRHQNRRLINPQLLTTAQTKLKPGGRIYVSTDVDFLWEDISKVFEANPNFIKVDDTEFWTGYYKTRWEEISQAHNRPTFYATFCTVK